MIKAKPNFDKSKEKIEDYQPMMAMAVRRIKAREEHLEDLQQEANLIFFEALEAWDNTKGVKFSGVLFIHLKKLNYRYWYKFQDKAYLFKLKKVENCNRAEGYNSRQEPQSDMLDPLNEAPTIDLKTSYLGLNADAKKLHTAITSGELITSLGKQLRITMNTIKKLAEEWGWDKRRLKIALDQLKEFILEMIDTVQHGATLCYAHNKLGKVGEA